MMRRPATAGAAIGKPTPSNYYTFNNGTISSPKLFPFLQQQSNNINMNNNNQFGEFNNNARPNTVSGIRFRKSKMRSRPNTVSGARFRKKSAKKKRGKSSRRSRRPNTSPVKGQQYNNNNNNNNNNTFVKNHGGKSLVYDESTIQLAKWSVAVELFDKKDKTAQKKRWEQRGVNNGKQRPQTSPAKLKSKGFVSTVNRNIVYPPTSKKKLLKTEHTLNQDILALIAQRTLAQELQPVYNMTPVNPLDPNEKEAKEEYLTKEETLARKRIEYEERAKEEYNKTHVKGEFKMLDVRTHDKIFRPFIAQEQRWLMKWGSSKFKDMRANCHVFRSLAKWEELKEEARIKYKKDRKEKIRKKKLQRKKKLERQMRASRGYSVY